MLTPHHSSFSHSDSFQKKTPIYIRVYVSLSLTRGRGPLYRGCKKIRGQGRGRKKGGPAETGRRSGWAPAGHRKPVCGPFPHGYPKMEPPGGEKRLYGPLRTRRGACPGPAGGGGENWERGVTPAAEGGKWPGICPGRPQEARVHAFPPPNPSWEPAGARRKTALRASQRPNAGNSPGENPTGNRPTGREILKGPRRRPETPENTAALALRGPQGPLPGPAGSPFFPP